VKLIYKQHGLEINSEHHFNHTQKAKSFQEAIDKIQQQPKYVACFIYNEENA